MSFVYFHCCTYSTYVSVSKMVCFAFDRVDLSSLMTTFLDTTDHVSHMQEDLFVPGNILFSTTRSMKTTNGKITDHIVGHKTRQFYQEGIGENAGFVNILSFLQLNHTTMLVLDMPKNCVRLVDRQTNRTSQFLGNCTAPGAYRNGNDPLFNSPRAIIHDSVTSNRLLLADAGTKSVRIINMTSWRVGSLVRWNSTFVPKGIVYQKNGNLNMSQDDPYGGFSVMEVDYVSGRISVMAGSIALMVLS